MKTFSRLSYLAVAAFAIGLSVTSRASAAGSSAPAPSRSTSDFSSDLDDLEKQLNHLEKNIGSYDERQRRSIYAKLLAMAEKIGVGLAVQRQLLDQAVASMPKNTKKDSAGAVTREAAGQQARLLAELNRLDDRLKVLRARLAALNPDKPADVGPGGGGGAGGGRTITPDGRSKRK